MGPSKDIKLGWKLPKREAHIKEIRKEEGKYKYQLKFQNQLITLPVYRVQIDFAKYRLENGRTQAAQEEYLATHSNQPEDFFIKDLEALEAQNVQHEILRKMLKTPQTDLIDYFKREEQQEPLILSSQGFVVNGNRRLCAMREIHAQDKTKFARYSHIEVVFLPSCSEKDIDELEAQLQIRPDIKQEYTWIAKACMLRSRQHAHSYTAENLANLYEMRKSEVEALLDLLGHVDDYLTSRGKDKHYHFVEKAQFAFERFQKARKKVKNIEEKDLYRELSYILIDGAEIEGRLYQLIPDVQKHLSKLIGELSYQLDIEDVEVPVSEDDLLGSSSISLLPIIKAVENPSNKETVTKIIDDVVTGENIKENEEKKARSVLEKVSRANTYLRNAINIIDDKSIKDGITEQLDEIELSASKLRNWLS